MVGQKLQDGIITIEGGNVDACWCELDNSGAGEIIVRRIGESIYLCPI
jgi:hypothetical protein